MLQFDQIEKKIVGLIKHCKSLEASNAELTAQVNRLETELQQKVETENTYAEQKAIIRSKIDGLLTKLDTLTEFKSQ
jgi:protein-arginine kinase activator protein McsA